MHRWCSTERRSTLGGNPFETEISFGAPHNLRVGQAVRYGHGAGGTDVGGLVDGQVYFVVSASAPNVLELAQTRGGPAIVVAAAAQGTAHALTPLAQWVQIGTLVGGTAEDAFTLQANGRLSGAIDGGAGANSLQGPDIDTAWTISGVDVGDLSVGTAIEFDGTSPGIFNPGNDELVLGAGHNLRTGQAVRYSHGPGGTDVVGLQDGQICYVRVVSDSAVQLSGSRAGALDGTNIININTATAGTRHALTPLVEWTRIGTLTGATADDKFTLQGGGRLTGSIAGGAGFNTIQGPDDDVTWTAFDRTLNRSDRVAFDAAASTFGVTAVNNDTLTIGNHTLVTGQAVVYHTSDAAQAITSLVDATTYFVIVDPGNPGPVKLARTQAAALANTPIAGLGAIPNGTTHSLTTALVFSDIQGLQGGTANDVFILVTPVVSPFGASILRIDGGSGSNVLATKLDSGAPLPATDQLVWAVTGADVGWVADGAGKFLTTGAAVFAQSAVGTDKTTLTLPSHRWQTGQAVVYRKTAGGDTGLAENTVYYVIRVDADTIKLATSPPNATAGTAISTLVSQGVGHTRADGGGWARDGGVRRRDGGRRDPRDHFGRPRAGDR